MEPYDFGNVKHYWGLYRTSIPAWRRVSVLKIQRER